jgi:hypothetical protein
MTTAIIGHASVCAVSKAHRPAPMRFVWHHIQPHVCGGLTVAANLVALCDSCHYSIHILLWHLGQATSPALVGTRAQRALAKQGYDLCVTAGTVAKIPKEAEGG